MKLKSIASFLLLLTAIPAFAASTPEKTIGATVGDFADLVRESLIPLLEKQGIHARLVEFTDYVQPNVALAEGSLDLNIFQHKPYLDQFAKERKLALAPLTQVPTAPLGLYGGKLKSLTEVKDRATIAVPNDPTNLARALTILADLGWITLPAKIDPFKITPSDIRENKMNLKIVELEAAQIPRALADVDYAVINGNYVVSAGLSLTAALAREKSDAYVNWAVVRSADLNSPFAKAVKEALRSKEFRGYAKSKFVGYKFPSDWK
jgi:D-methionine transport system substrate-binding protein